MIRLVKYVVFPSIYDYDKVTYQTMEKKDYIFVFSSISEHFKFKITKFLIRVHFSLKINRIFNIPFKILWIKHILNSFLKNNDRIIFLFYESNRLSLDYKLLSELKRFYTNSSIVFRMSNSISNNRIPPIYKHIKDYDLVITFDPLDAIKFNIQYIQYEYEPLFEKSDNQKLYYDLLFIGNNKGRIDILHTIYLEFKKCGLKCLFIVNNVDKDKQVINEPNFIYNEPISYKQVLEKVQESKILLEVLQGYQNGQTLRYREAIYFNKYLLSNNRELFDNDDVPLLSIDKNICEFLPDNFKLFKPVPNNNILSVDNFLLRIENILQQK